MIQNHPKANIDMNTTERICRSRSKNKRPRIFSGNRSYLKNNDSLLGGVNNISDTNITLEGSNL